MIERSTSKVRVSESSVRYQVRVANEDCPAGTLEAELRKSELLRVVLEQPAAFHCGPARWERLAIYHDGSRWAAEASAEVNEPEEEEDGW